MTIRVPTNPAQSLSAPWRYGAHVSGPGWEGYYLLGTPWDAANPVAVFRPDVDAETAEDYEAYVADLAEVADDDARNNPGRRAPAYRVSLDDAGHVLVTYPDGTIEVYVAVGGSVYRVDEDNPGSSGVRVMEPGGSGATMIARRDLLAQMRGYMRAMARDVEAWEGAASLRGEVAQQQARKNPRVVPLLWSVDNGKSEFMRRAKSLRGRVIVTYYQPTGIRNVALSDLPSGTYSLRGVTRSRTSRAWSRWRAVVRVSDAGIKIT